MSRTFSVYVAWRDKRNENYEVTIGSSHNPAHGKGQPVPSEDMRLYGEVKVQLLSFLTPPVEAVEFLAEAHIVSNVTS
jgi:hypothetical protein